MSRLQAESNEGMSGIEADPKKPPFEALSGRFLKRTALAILATLALVALTALTYGYPRWAGYYFFAGIWTLAFLSLTPLVLKAMMFDRRPLRGLGLIALKIALLALMMLTLMHWSADDKNVKVLGTGLVAGVTTPLLVIVLRVLGGALNPRPTKPNNTTEGKP